MQLTVMWYLIRHENLAVEIEALVFCIVAKPAASHCGDQSDNLLIKDKLLSATYLVPEIFLLDFRLSVPRAVHSFVQHHVAEVYFPR